MSTHSTSSTRLAHHGRRALASLQARLVAVRRTAEAGMTTAEYAVGTVAAVAFAAVLIGVVRSGAVKSALTAIITNALKVG